MMTRATYYATHRCAGSLNANASIRLEQDFGDETPMTWYLRVLDYDWEYMRPFLNGIGEIFYCPWCGQRLG